VERIVEINDFCKRQTEDSQFTHFSGTWDALGLLATELIMYAKKYPEYFDNPLISEGYRNGVIIIHVPFPFVHRFFTYSDFPMFEGMKLSAVYEKVPGREYEPPKLQVKIEEDKKRCNYVDLILYHHDVLEEDKDASTDAEWEIVSINGRLNEDPPPMDPITIVRNWKHLPGGTEMKGKTAEEVLEMICDSILWKNNIKL
jgi:hypothetical protein